MWDQGGLPVAISMTVQATDQMSAARPTPFWWITSGAIQWGVPLMLCLTPLSAPVHICKSLQVLCCATALLFRSSADVCAQACYQVISCHGHDIHPAGGNSCAQRPGHATRLAAHVPMVARLSIFFEAPKSASLTRPMLSTRMLAPLMSRCMIPLP